MDAIKNEAPKYTILLNSLEKKMTKFHIPSPGTVTLFKKNEGSNEEVEQYLRGRVAEIVSANPWLASTINKSPEHGVIAQYGTRETLPDCFTLGSSRPLSITKGGYKEFASSFMDCLVPSTNATVDKPIPVFKVTLVPGEGNDSNSLAIVVSLSHVIGDGHTFYQIHNMLSQTAQIRALNPERPTNLDDAMRAAMAPGEYDLILSDREVGANIGSTLNLCAFEVDNNTVNEKKEAYKAATGTEPRPPFISTNDIITSWAMTSTNCDVGEMVVNMRSRLTALPNGGDNMAGNIAIVLCYRPQDYRTPELIRRSITVKVGVYQRAGKGSLPEFLANLKYNKTIVTNLATFAKDLDLPGCTQILHFPLLEVRCGFSTAWLFRPRKGVTAVMVASTTIKPEELEKDPLMGDRIF